MDNADRLQRCAEFLRRKAESLGGLFENYLGVLRPVIDGAADYRGLRVSELVDLRWAQVDFATARGEACLISGLESR